MSVEMSIESELAVSNSATEEPSVVHKYPILMTRDCKRKHNVKKNRCVIC